MKIIVCIKQVPDTTEIRWTEDNTMQREGVESIINPYDLFAIEAALNIKKNVSNVEITVISMGPLQAVDIIKKAIALGCDRGILLSDKKFAGADTYATGKTIAAAIKSKFPDFDLIICGQFAIDGDTAQTGPAIASQLGIPQVTFVEEVKKADETSLYVVRKLEEGFETVRVEYPSLICMLKSDKETSRPSINGVRRAQNSSVEIFSMADINLEEAGIKASPTFVSRAFRPENRRGVCKYIDNVDELSAKIKEFINE